MSPKLPDIDEVLREALKHGIGGIYPDEGQLRTLVADNPDTALVAPVHPNPKVKAAVERVLSGQERVFLIEPLDYAAFLGLLQTAWLIVSDSGGVQEEVASLGKPLLVLRAKTERPEAIEVGVAKMAGEWPGQLKELLDDRNALGRWIDSVEVVANPFGDLQSPERIAAAFADFLSKQVDRASLVP